MKDKAQVQHKELFCYVVQSIMDMITVGDELCDIGFNIGCAIVETTSAKAASMQKKANELFSLKEDENGSTYIDWFIESWHCHKLKVNQKMYSAIVGGKEYTPKTPSQLYNLMKRTGAFK